MAGSRRQSSPAAKPPSPDAEPRRRTDVVIAVPNTVQRTVFKSSSYAPSYRFPYNPDPLVNGNNYAVYDEMRVDDQIKACLSLKKNFVLDSGWEIVCDDEAVSDAATENFNNLNTEEALDSTFEDVLRDILSSYDYGFSISEPIFHYKFGRWEIRTIKVRPPHTFLFDLNDGGDVIAIKQSTNAFGEVMLKPSEIFHHVYQPEFGNPYGVSDLRSAFVPFTRKKHFGRFWAVYLERYASPTPIGRYPQGIQEDEVARILAMLKTIQTSTAIAFPEGTVVDFLQSKNDTSDVYQSAMDYCNMTIARSLLVPDLIGIGGAEKQGGSFALGKKHFEIFLKTIAFDRKSLQRKITQRLLKPYVALNFGPNYAAKFRFLPPTDEQIIEYAKAWSEAVRGNAFSPNDDEVNYFRKILGFPEGDVNHPAPPAVAVPGAGGGAMPAAGKGMPGAPTELVPAYADTRNFRELTATEKKVNFVEIRRDLDNGEERLLSAAEKTGRAIWRDFVDQIRSKGIVQDFRPERIAELKPRFLKDMNVAVSAVLLDLFKTGMKDAEKELNPKGFSAAKYSGDLLPEEFLRVLRAMSFKMVGDYTGIVSKKATNILMDSVKAGDGISDTVKLLNEELDHETTKWLNTVVRTTTTEVYNEARRSYWENDEYAKDIVTGYGFSAILDDRTSSVCRHLDGMHFEGGDVDRVTPPLHYNCRSLLVPVTRFEADVDFDAVPSAAQLEEWGAFASADKRRADAPVDKKAEKKVVPPAPPQVINVAAPEVKFTPTINVPAAPRLIRTDKKVIRDAAGRVTGMQETPVYEGDK